MLRTNTRLLLALVAGIAVACFNPPTDDVLFSCDPMGDDSCPAGYSCEADGCCHKDGTDVQASWGACGLGGNETGTATETDTTGTDTTGTDTTGTESTDTETETTETETDTTGTDTGTETDTTDATDTDTGTETDTTSG